MTRIVSLGEIVEIKGGGTPDKSVESYWGGEIPWASVKDFKSAEITQTVDSITPLGVVNSATNVIPAGSILVPTRMAVGKVAINAVDMAINQDLKALKLKAGVDTRYLLNALMAKAPSLEAQATGATVKGITLDMLRSLEIPLPPLEEQKRIAAILDQADDIRRKRQHAIDRLNQLGQAIFHEMFGRGDSSAIPLSDYFEEIRMGPFGSMLHKSDYVDGGIPLINPMHITDGKIAPNPKFSIEQRKAKELSSYRLKEGDVVVGRRGEMGRCAVVLAAHDGYLCGTGSMFLRAAVDKADPFFITELIKSKNVIKKIEAVASGVTMMNLNSTSFDRVMVPKISIEEQQAYFKRVRFISDSMQTLKNHLSRTNYLFASLQHRAFAGEL